MNTHLKNRKQFSKNLNNKSYRTAFVEKHITNGLAFQIRAMRIDRDWKQKQLAEKIGSQQEAVSRLENPDYGKFTLDTLKKLASAFDVALIVKFAPFHELLDRALSLSHKDLAVPDFAGDKGMNNWEDVTGNVSSIMKIPEGNSLSQYSVKVESKADELPKIAQHG